MDEATLGGYVEQYLYSPPALRVDALFLDGLDLEAQQGLRGFLRGVGATAVTIAELDEDGFQMDESPIDEHESTLHGRLDETIADGLTDLPADPLHATIIRKLEGTQRIVTLRDLVVRAREGAYGARGLSDGSKSTGIVESLLHARLGVDFVWPKSPNLGAIAWACSSLSQVNAGIIAPRFAGFTMQQVLDMSPEERVLHLSDKPASALQQDEVNRRIADEGTSARMYTSFLAVAHAFRRERTRMRIEAADSL